MEKSERFSGQGSIEQFLQKVDIHCALKGYDNEEKKAQALASKLNGVAFEVYMRLSNNEKKNYSTLKEELRKEFKKGRCVTAVACFSIQRRFDKNACI